MAEFEEKTRQAARRKQERTPPTKRKTGENREGGNKKTEKDTHPRRESLQDTGLHTERKTNMCRERTRRENTRDINRAPESAVSKNAERLDNSSRQHSSSLLFPTPLHPSPHFGAPVNTPFSFFSLFPFTFGPSFPKPFVLLGKTEKRPFLSISPFPGFYFLQPNPWPLTIWARRKCVAPVNDQSKVCQRACHQASNQVRLKVHP